VIFAGHDVRQMAQADASNLREAATRIVELIGWARRNEKRALIFLTGVPGSGKTLAGLQAVHDAIATEDEREGDVVYLSGNTPLVTVLREALARNESQRHRGTKERKSLKDIRRVVRARIQHINDFLKEVLHSGIAQVPYEHAIVFDEAQRAWDEKQGLKKFSRTASEPALLLEIMGLRRDWCACVCLVGGGQEINSGERGISGWGDAIRGLSTEGAKSWVVFGPPDVVPTKNSIRVELGLNARWCNNVTCPGCEHPFPEKTDWKLLIRGQPGGDDIFGNYSSFTTRFYSFLSPEALLNALWSIGCLFQLARTVMYGWITLVFFVTQILSPQSLRSNRFCAESYLGNPLPSLYVEKQIEKGVRFGAGSGADSRPERVQVHEQDFSTYLQTRSNARRFDCAYGSGFVWPDVLERGKRARSRS